MADDKMNMAFLRSLIRRKHKRQLIHYVLMTAYPDRASPAASSLIELNRQIRACRLCHAEGYLNQRESVPLARDPEPDAPLPRILLVGQSPGLRATNENRPFAGAAGDKLRAWDEMGGIAPQDFWRKIHFSAVTKCYPGRLPGARGDRVPTPREQQLCRPWLDAQLAILQA